MEACGVSKCGFYRCEGPISPVEHMLCTGWLFNDSASLFSSVLYPFHQPQGEAVTLQGWN